VSESRLQEFAGDRVPVPAVSPEDLKRVWAVLSAEPAGTGFSLDVLATVCEPNADLLAVWFRAGLVWALLQRGALRSGSTVQNRVFEVVATFPRRNGPAEADLDALVAATEQSGH
jgi:hypothetical protein